MCLKRAEFWFIQGGNALKLKYDNPNKKQSFQNLELQTKTHFADLVDSWRVVCEINIDVLI